MVSIQLSFEHIVINIRTTKQITSEYLRNKALKAFPQIKQGSNLSFIWIDDEGDSITATSDEEINLAVDTMTELPNVVVRFRVIPQDQLQMCPGCQHLATTSPFQGGLCVDCFFSKAQATPAPVSTEDEFSFPSLVDSDSEFELDFDLASTFSCSTPSSLSRASTPSSIPPFLSDPDLISGHLHPSSEPTADPPPSPRIVDYSNPMHLTLPPRLPLHRSPYSSPENTPPDNLLPSPPVPTNTLSSTTSSSSLHTLPFISSSTSPSTLPPSSPLPSNPSLPPPYHIGTSISSAFPPPLNPLQPSPLSSHSPTLSPTESSSSTPTTSTSSSSSTSHPPKISLPTHYSYTPPPLPFPSLSYPLPYSFRYPLPIKIKHPLHSSPPLYSPSSLSSSFPPPLFDIPLSPLLSSPIPLLSSSSSSTSSSSSSFSHISDSTSSHIPSPSLSSTPTPSPSTPIVRAKLLPTPPSSYLSPYPSSHIPPPPSPPPLSLPPTPFNLLASLLLPITTPSSTSTSSLSSSSSSLSSSSSFYSSSSSSSSSIFSLASEERKEGEREEREGQERWKEELAILSSLGLPLPPLPQLLALLHSHSRTGSTNQDMSSQQEEVERVRDELYSLAVEDSERQERRRAMEIVIDQLLTS